MRNVFVTGTGVTPFGLHLHRDLKSLAAEAVLEALADAELAVPDVQAVFFGNAMLGMITGLESLRGTITLFPLGFGHIPIVDVSNACATGANAAHLGWLAVSSGHYDTVLVVGAEKANLADRARTFAAYSSSFDPDEERFEVSEGVNVTRTALVDRQAMLAESVMAERQLSERHLGLLAAINHHHGSLNPKAHRRAGLGYQQVMADKMLVPPIRRPMMSPISDGAAAVVLTSSPSVGHSARVRIAGSRLATRPAFDEPHAPAAIETAADTVYEAAGVGPDEIDVAEIHDASVVYELVSLRATGLCPAGREAEYIEAGAFRIDGHIPVNTSGGQIARGHAVGATGIAQIAEITNQLRGTSGRMQVPNARTGLAHIAGGVLRAETAVAGAHVLIRH